MYVHGVAWHHICIGLVVECQTTSDCSEYPAACLGRQRDQWKYIYSQWVEVQTDTQCNEKVIIATTCSSMALAVIAILTTSYACQQWLLLKGAWRFGEKNIIKNLVTGRRTGRHGCFLSYFSPPSPQKKIIIKTICECILKHHVVYLTLIDIHGW